MHLNYWKSLRTIATLVLALCVVAPRNGWADAQASTNSVTSWWDKHVPSEIKTLASGAKTLGAFYSDAKTAVDVGRALLTAIGVLEATGVDLQKEFEALHDHLDDVGTALEWRILASFRAKRLAAVEGAILRIGQGDVLHMPIGLDSPAETLARNAVLEAEDPDQFKRRYVARATENNSNWTRAIRHRPVKDSEGQVYDWRLGVPELMQLIALRLQIIAAVDRDFRTDGAFNAELVRHRTVLDDHYNIMFDGVSCGYYDNYLDYEEGDSALERYVFKVVVCADIYTGLAAGESFLAYKTWPPYGHEEHYYGSIEDEVSSRKERLYRELLLKLPLFEMRSLIDTLYLYANPVIEDPQVVPTIPLPAGGRDPAAAKADNMPRSEIPPPIVVAEAPDLCLDVQGGNPAAGTPVWLWPCHGGEAQQWVYDRPSGTIRNPVYDKCLDVQWGNPAPSTPVWIWDCIGSDAQKWTYDPATGVLQNALGTVLDIQWGALQASTPVWTWDRHEGPAQRWLVEG